MEMHTLNGLQTSGMSLQPVHGMSETAPSDFVHYERPGDCQPSSGAVFTESIPDVTFVFVINRVRVIDLTVISMTLTPIDFCSNPDARTPPITQTSKYSDIHLLFSITYE